MGDTRSHRAQRLQIKIFRSFSGRRLQAEECAWRQGGQHELSANDIHLWQKKTRHDSCGVDHARCWEHDMATSTHSRTLLASAAAAALAGTALAGLLAGNIATSADAGSGADTQLSLANPD